MKRISVLCLICSILLSLACLRVVGAEPPACVDVSVYSGYTPAGGGAPYSDYVGSFSASGVSFATDTDYAWHPFGLGEFGAVIMGCLSVEADGDYSICLDSDDGSILFIDSNPVVDNGGSHARTKTCAQVSLTAGFHKFEIQFFECCAGPSGIDLDLPEGVWIVCCPPKCPLSQGHWKNDPDAWPVDTLTLGTISYEQDELLALLNLPVGSRGGADASLLLAHQLIAAKLNIAAGSDPAPIAASITAADALIGANSIPIVPKVKPASSLGHEMVNLSEILDRYNNGFFTGDCQP